MKKWIKRFLYVAVISAVLFLLVGYGSGFFSRFQPVTPVDYFAKYEALRRQSLIQAGGDGVDDLSQNGFRDMILALGPMAFGVSQTYEESLHDDSIESERWWYENEWTPICERFGIDPHAEAPYAHHVGLYSWLIQPTGESTNDKSTETTETDESATVAETSSQKTSQESSDDTTVHGDTAVAGTSLRNMETSKISNALSVPWRAADYPEAQEWLDYYAPVFDTLEKAVRKPFYFSYYGPKMSLSVLFSRDASAARTMACMLRIRIYRRLADDAGRDVEGAIRDIETLFLLSRHYQQNPFVIIRMMVGSILPIEQVQHLLRMGVASDAQLTELQHFLESLPPIPDWKASIQCEEYYACEYIQMLCRRSSTDLTSGVHMTFQLSDYVRSHPMDRAGLYVMAWFPLDPDALIATIHRVFEEPLQMAAQSDPVERQRLHDQWQQKNNARMGANDYCFAWIHRIFSPQQRLEALAAACSECTTSNILLIIHLLERQENEIRLSQIGIALERYRLAHPSTDASQPTANTDTLNLAPNTDAAHDAADASADVADDDASNPSDTASNSDTVSNSDTAFHGEYPQTLDALVEARLMDRIPTDVCNRPFVYRPGDFTPPKIAKDSSDVTKSAASTDTTEKYAALRVYYPLLKFETRPFLLYSLGPNGVDDTAAWLQSGKTEMSESECSQNDDRFF